MWVDHTFQERLVVISTVWTVLRLATVGIAALSLGFAGSPVALALNTYWFLLLLLAIALVGGVAWARPAVALLAGEAVATLAVLQGLWPLLFPHAPLVGAPGAETNGARWRLVFTDLDQAVAKYIPVPAAWPDSDIWLRVDLGSDYKGQAGFEVTINGRRLGVLKNEPQNPGYVGDGAARWLMRVPRDVLAMAPVARVELSPTALDPRLSIAGHSDVRVDPLRDQGSWFFDGRAWHTDRLAGPSGPRVTGTYRIWFALSELGVPIG
jgi:hypothetical protein